MKIPSGAFLVLALGALSAWILRLEARRPQAILPSGPAGPAPSPPAPPPDPPPSPPPARRILSRPSAPPARPRRPPSAKVLLAGRILDPSGRPRREERWRFLFTRPGPEGEREARLLAAPTDGEGRFLVPFPFPGNRSAPVRLRIRPLGRGGRALPGEEIRRDLAPAYPEGTTRLGDLHLEAQPLLVSGQAASPGGRPLPGVRLRIWLPRRFLGASPRKGTPLGLDTWIPGPWKTRTGRDGSFRILGRTRAPWFRLRAEGEGWLQGDPLSLAPGTTGVLLLLRRGGSLEGRVRLPSGLEAGRIWLQARPERPLGEEGPPPSVFPGPAGRFRFPALPPGPVRLEVRDFWDGRLLQAVPNLEIRPGRTCRDPRLLPLDLAGEEGWSLLLVRGPAGRPLEEALAWDPLSRPHRILRGPGGRILLPPSAGPDPLYVWAPGHQIVPVARRRAGRGVELPAGIPLRLEPAEELPPPPPPWRLAVGLTLLPRRGDPLQEGAAFLLGRSGLPPRSSSKGGRPAWEFLLPLPGTYRLDWRLTLEGKREEVLAPPAGDPSPPVLRIPPGGICPGRSLPLRLPRRTYLSLLKKAERIYASLHEER